MTNDDIPDTLDAEQVPLPSSTEKPTRTALESEAAKEAPPSLDLRGYELLDRLGGGGMGDVYRAIDPALGRDLAVKVIKAQLQGYAAAENRFVREARITGSLQHPGIVPVYNLGQLADGRLHYTMRLVRGCTLADILHEEAGKPERWPGLLTIFEKICQAVAYAHSKRVIHRDLKPANVMVGRFGEVQVMDWGLAKLLKVGERGCGSDPREEEQGGTRIQVEADDTPAEPTRMGQEMGTPAYMPLEQALGEWDTVDERSDVFALGAILCEILTGQPPYGREREETLRKAKRGDVAEALSGLENCGAEAALVELCRDCLAAREGRPRNAEQVARRVTAYQAEVQERLRRAELERATAIVKAREERKKRRWMWAAVAALLAGIAVSGWLALRATKAEGQARENEGLALNAAEAERTAKRAAQQAAEAERQAKKLAQNRLGQLEKANEVLTAIFADLDPHAEEKGGPSLRQQLRQHLERAAAQLDEVAVDDPLAAARLQFALGGSLINLGQPKPAIELLTKARATLEAQLGPDHRDTLSCRNSLALAYWSGGRDTDAIRLHEQNLKQYEAQLGPDHPTTLRSRNNLALAYWAAGRTADAIRLYEQNLQLYEAKYGTDHPDTLNARNGLGAAYWSAGRNADAIRLLKQTLKQREDKLGPNHPDTLITRSNLASAYKSAGRTNDAIRLHEQNVQQMETKLGPDHPSTLLSRNNLANAYMDAGDTAKAIRLYEDNLKRQEAQLGVDHPDTLFSRSNLALAYKTVGRLADSIRLNEQTLKQRESKLGADHPETLTSRSNLAEAYWAVGRTEDAILLHEQTLKQREAKLGADHPDTLGSRNNLAEAYRSSGRSEDAIRLHEGNLKLYETKLGADHPTTLTARNNLALAYWSAGRTTEAIPLLEQNLKQREAKLGTDHADTLLSLINLGVIYRDAGRLAEAITQLETALQRGRQRAGGLPAVVEGVPSALAGLYERAGNLAKAESLYRDILEETQRQFGPDDARTASAIAPLGANLLKQKKYADAEPLLRQCLNIREKKQAEEWTTFNTRSVLGEALVGQKKFAEAEPLLVQGYEGMKQRQDKISATYRQVRLTEALERLVHLYEVTDQKEKRADWQKKLDEIRVEPNKSKP